MNHIETIGLIALVEELHAMFLCELLWLKNKAGSQVPAQSNQVNEKPMSSH